MTLVVCFARCAGLLLCFCKLFNFGLSPTNQYKTDNKEKLQQYKKQYVKVNEEKIIKQRQKYYKNNKEIMKKTVNEYYHTDKKN